jgi:hypothetical protein
MYVQEITEKVLAQRKISGKTPQKTVSGILQRSRYVEAVGNGFYRIKS